MNQRYDDFFVATVRVRNAVAERFLLPRALTAKVKPEQLRHRGLAKRWTETCVATSSEIRLKCSRLGCHRSSFPFCRRLRPELFR
jgi:hypothetical protein